MSKKFFLLYLGVPQKIRITRSKLFILSHLDKCYMKPTFILAILGGKSPFSISELINKINKLRDK